MQANKVAAEAKLALGLQEALRKLEYICYPELDRVDIVARRGNEVLAIECKARLDLKVLAQAWQHREKASAVYIAVPGKDLCGDVGWAIPKFLRSVARTMNIGVLGVSWDHSEIRKWDTWVPGDQAPTARINWVHYPPLVGRKDLSWDNLMVPEAETYSTPGGPGQKAWTKTRIWELEVKRYLREHPRSTAREVLGALRPPGVHKKTGRPRKVLQQDVDRLLYFANRVFRGTRTENGVIILTDEEDTLCTEHRTTSWLAQGSPRQRHAPS